MFSSAAKLIYAGSELILATASAKNISVHFDNTRSMSSHVNSLCKTAFYHLRNLATIRRFLSHKLCEILIHAFVTSRFDYCNSFIWPPSASVAKTPVGSKCCCRSAHVLKYEHISPILKELHGLPIKSKIEFKILILTFKAYYEIAPQYLTDSD